MKGGLAGCGEKVVCVDFDATLYEWGPLYGKLRPNPGAREALERFKEAGWTVVIFTSRMSPTWWEADGVDPWEQQQFIEDRLADDDIPYDYITSEKVPATAYIDDRAIAFTGSWYDMPGPEALENW